MPDGPSLMRRARRLTMADWATVIESVAIALRIEVALRLTSFSQVQRRFVRVPRSLGKTESTPAVGELYSRLTRFTSATYRILPLRATCLRESLVLCALLNRRGVPARLCLGVRKEGPALAAHAWVECEGIAPESVPSFCELRGVAS